MKSKCFLQLIFFCMFVFMPLLVHADELKEDEAVAFAQVQGQNLIKTFAKTDTAEKYRALDNLFTNYIDLDYISRFVIGKYWRDMSAEQRITYQNLFRRYAMAVYKGFPLVFNRSLNFSINGAEREGDSVVVMTNISYIPGSGDPLNVLVAFRMHKQDDVIKMTDIKIGESSLILSYRNRFYQMMKDAAEEPEWFLEDFAAITDSTEKTYALTAE